VADEFQLPSWWPRTWGRVLIGAMECTRTCFRLFMGECDARMCRGAQYNELSG
jgi:hypothetical protein